jgi:hypothetical protein
MKTGALKPPFYAHPTLADGRQIWFELPAQNFDEAKSEIINVYEDLTDYCCSAPGRRRGPRNVGWLDRAHKFDSTTPMETTLNQLWEHCRIFVMETRGLHCCELCEMASKIFVERNGQQIRLGSLQIRVWSKTAEVYGCAEFDIPLCPYPQIQTA